MNPCLLPLALGFAASAFGQASDPARVLSPPQFTNLERYQVSYAATLKPIAINQMHQWTVRVTDADGNPIANADIQVSGAMPAHDHGLPTAPRATTYLGDGNYLIEGMKFHMGGAWEVMLTVDAAQGRDALSLSLDL